MSISDTVLREENILVTPEVARSILKNNTRNRKIRVDHVRNLAEAMKTGRWITTGTSSAIQFCEDGTLIDGQHRLLAVIMADVNIMFRMIYDLPEKAILVIDAGKPRSPVDALRIRGNDLCNTKTLASIRCACGNTHPLDVQELEEFYILYQREIEIVKRFFDNKPGKGTTEGHGKRRIQKSYIGATILLALLNGEDEEVVNGFIRTLGLYVAANNGEETVIRFANKIHIEGSTHRKSADLRQWLAITQRVYIAYKKNELLIRFYAPSKLFFPIIKLSDFL